MNRYIGIDVHQDDCHGTVQDESDFEVIAEFEQGDKVSKDHELFAPMKITWF